MATRRLLWRLFTIWYVLALLPLALIVWAAARQVTFADLAITGAISALLLAVGTLLLAKQFVDPLNEIRRAVRRFARGDLSFRLRGLRHDEFGEVRRGLNKMAAQLEDRLKKVAEQQNEQESVFGGMREAVLTIALDERVMKVNRAARDLLHISAPDVTGRSIEEVIRVSELQRFIRETLHVGRACEADIVVSIDSDRQIQAYSRILADDVGCKRGVLIVLNDVTRIRQLEKVRRDFVANVSHELKTPITSIKGFVETLLDGKVSDAAEQRRFLSIIAKHADRLNAIFDDLLSLSQIERDEERGEVALEREVVQDVVRTAIQTCELRAQEKEVALRLIGDEPVWAQLNRSLFEQAIVNLIDNAVKYSEAKSSVEIVVRNEGGSAIIAVRDHGAGIEQRHLGRLFERFYRVDSARSRKQGGTGLGLSIVKHIVQMHGGEISVESTPGEGSTFSISIPAVAERS